MLLRRFLFLALLLWGLCANLTLRAQEDEFIPEQAEQEDAQANAGAQNKEDLEAIAKIGIDDVITESAAAWRRPVVPQEFPFPGMDLEVTCEDPKAGQHIVAGIHYLHLSWDQEALRHFVAALRIDSRAPLAWWGVAMSLIPHNNEFEAQRNKAMAKLSVLKQRADHPWEVDLIDSLLVFPIQGSEGTVKKLEELLQNKPGDLNAQLLMTNFLRDGHFLDGQSKPSLLRAQRVVQKLRQQYPGHPLVLRYEMGVRFPAPQSRLAEAAAVLDVIAPALLSPWLHYEAAQLAYALGRYQQAQQYCSQGRAMVIGWMAGSDVNPEDAPMLAKLTELEVYALLELGQVSKAQRLAKEAASYRIKDPKRVGSAGHLALVHHARILPAIIEERFGNWKGALEKLPQERGDYESELAPWAWEARKLYYIGEQSAAKGDLETLRQAHITLNGLGQRYQESASRIANNMGAMEHWYREQRRMDQYLHFLFSRVAELRDDQDLAGLQLRKALEKREMNQRRPPPLTPRQPRQQLGLLAFKTGDTQLAKRAFNQALLNASVNQATAWLGLAESYAALGDPRAGRTLQVFERTWSNADRDHPLLQPYWNRAAALKQKLQVSSP